MSKEKQIEEIANAIYDDPNAYDTYWRSHCERLAETIYNAGYRKQSVGKWIWINQATGYLEPPYGDTCKCSLCEFVIDISESNYNFCPNCGARMKGGAE